MTSAKPMPNVILISFVKIYTIVMVVKVAITRQLIVLITVWVWASLMSVLDFIFLPGGYYTVIYLKYNKLRAFNNTYFRL